MTLAACGDDAPPQPSTPAVPAYCERVRADYRRAVDASQIGQLYAGARSVVGSSQSEVEYLRTKYPECF